MKIVFVSNYLNHFTLPFCETLVKECQDFYFISTKVKNNVAFRNEISAKYVLHANNDKEKEKIQQIVLDADAAIMGDGSDPYIAQRMKNNKLTFVWSERIFKLGTWRRFIPTIWYSLYKRFLKYRNKNLYVLCASAYLPYDLSLLGFPVEKCFRWGYFPYVKKYPDFNKLYKEKQFNRFIWVGRLIPLKHPELGIYLIDMLKKLGYEARLDIIGSGPMEYELRRIISEKKLEENVHLEGGKSLEEVRNCMEKSTFFLFSSDFNEGWGAVVNEAMNSGCVVICSHAAGSVPFLVNNNINGMIFKSEDLQLLLSSVLSIIENPQKCEELAKKGYDDIQQHWNAEQAALRFLELCKCILEYRKSPYSSGPCSEASCLSNEWFK